MISSFVLFYYYFNQSFVIHGFRLLLLRNFFFLDDLWIENV